jgi:hypothetical protein
MSLVLAYEQADWHNTSLLMVRYGVDVDTLTKAYVDSLYWYRQLLDAIKDEEVAEEEASLEVASELENENQT